MPARHKTKQYSENGYYHIYNRGVEKRAIFLDEQDYGIFLSYLKEYLLPKDEKELYDRLGDPQTSYKEKDKILKALRLKNFNGEITLLSYCLMPNHIHLLVKQKGAKSIDKFMKSLFTRYTMYFNKKHRRVGQLCQDIYKAVLVGTDEQLLYLTCYIHQNPLKKQLASQGRTLRAYLVQPSSYPEYLGQRKTEWIHPEEILAFFSQTNPKLSYQAFVEGNEDPISPISSVLIESY